MYLEARRRQAPPRRTKKIRAWAPCQACASVGARRSIRRRGSAGAGAQTPGLGPYTTNRDNQTEPLRSVGFGGSPRVWRAPNTA